MQAWTLGHVIGGGLLVAGTAVGTEIDSPLRAIDADRHDTTTLTMSFDADAWPTLREAYDTDVGLRWRQFPLPGRQVDLSLHPIRVIEEGFTAVVVGEDGPRRVAPTVATFRGTIEGRPSYVFLAISPTQVNGYLMDGPDRTYMLSSGRPGEHPGRVTLVDSDALGIGSGMAPWMCWNTQDDGDPGLPLPAGNDLDVDIPRVRIADIFTEVQHDVRALFETAEETVDYAVTLVTASSDIYRRDLGAPLRVPDGYIRVWETVPPWGEISGNGGLFPFTNYWRSEENPLRDTPRAVVQLLTHPVFGGFAWAYGGVCSHQAGFALSSVQGYFPTPIEHTHEDNWDLLIVSHELGHLFGSVHTFSYDPAVGCHDDSGPDSGTIMSYCNNAPGGIANVGMRFHPVVQNAIRTLVAEIDCVEVITLDPGDWDYDGDLDLADLAAADMCINLGFESSGCLEVFDLDGDDQLTECDYAIMETLLDPQKVTEDCNGNGVADDCDIETKTSTDCDGNGMPDECQPGWQGDCDGDGVSDFCQIEIGAAADIDGNGVPDSCQEQILVPTAEHPTIQAAIDAAETGDEIIIANGYYSGVGNRAIDFHGKLITVRSANGPMACVIDAGGVASGFIFESGETPATRLVGVAVINGLAETEGGGIVCRNGSSPTIAECVLGSSVAEQGGGLACVDGSDAVVVDCTISDNAAQFTGGGVFVRDSTPLFLDCVIESNESASGGGGIRLEIDAGAVISGCRVADNDGGSSGGGISVVAGSDALVERCEITGNTADDGGGICTTSCHVVVTDSLIDGNIGEEGGGIHSSLSANLVVRRCTFAGNYSANDDGHGLYMKATSSTIENSIVFNLANGPQIRLETWASAYISHSLIRGGTDGVSATQLYTLTWGEGILDDDPQFVDGETGNFRLAPTSPGIDAGDPTYEASQSERDLDGGDRVLEGDGDGLATVDMGAYELDTPCTADLDGDGSVGALDLVTLINAWGATGENPADLNGDGEVGVYDLIELIGQWGNCGS
jgi:hypothetical protein